MKLVYKGREKNHKDTKIFYLLCAFVVFSLSIRL
jgi:hypothetical protein